MAQRVVRVLALDGGGVRGLSELYILQELLRRVDLELVKLHTTYGIPTPKSPLKPTEVFDIVVGTSTGGLIALMIVKLNMTVEQCIQAYQKMAVDIFGKPRMLGRLTWGLGVEKYSGKKLQSCVIQLINEYTNRDQEYLMEDVNLHQIARQAEDLKAEERLLCTLVCRELASDWTKERKDRPVFLCSDRCRPQLTGTYKKCRIWEAARATSAAPTYFPVQKVLNKMLVDGGYGDTNNPSEEAAMHYRSCKKITEQDSVRWVNIGTGSRHWNTQPRPRSFADYFIRGPIRRARDLMRDMEIVATQSDRVGDKMEYIAAVTTMPNSGGQTRVRFDRFSADTGVAGIELDDYKATRPGGLLESMTKEYLNEATHADVLDRLQKVAIELAVETFARRRKDYLLRRSSFNQTAAEYPPRSSSVKHQAVGTSRVAAGLLPVSAVPGLTSERTAETSTLGDVTPAAAHAEIDHINPIEVDPQLLPNFETNQFTEVFSKHQLSNGALQEDPGVDIALS